MLSGMLMVRGEICGCTGFTGDSGASRFAFLPLDRAVKVILMLVLGNLKVHLEENNTGKVSFWRIHTKPGQSDGTGGTNIISCPHLDSSTEPADLD